MATRVVSRVARVARRAPIRAASPLAEYDRKRDFTRTAEPAGGAPVKRTGALRFVIQKHAASHLHFDVRLEIGGTMKSWAVPKGPSTDPSVKRLAMQVEDHPVAYNTFEGTIPKGQYGGGTVMLWDRGTYEALNGDDRTLQRDYDAGRLEVVFHGERLEGEWTFVRTNRPGRAQWLMIKRRDVHASEDDIVAREITSVDTGRTMDEIGRGKPSRPRPAKKAAKKAEANARARSAVRALPAKGGASKIPTIEPMLASVATEVPTGKDWTFEPKYDGIRVLAYATAESARLITRNGNDKGAQFGEIVDALRAFASKLKRSVVLDGEIVALEHGKPARFQGLQGRMHATEASTISLHRESSPASLVAFDILVDGDEVLVGEPWTARRSVLEKRLAKNTSPQLLLGETNTGNGAKLVERAQRQGWEGVIAKRTDVPYASGRRSDHWRKLKVEHRQEFVIGGYTEPRNSRQHLGAMLLGYFDARGQLVYVGHTGGGFTQEGLRDMAKRLEPLEQTSSPFTTTIRTNEQAHWVKPEVVVEVKFIEWTADGRLRQPIFVGVRDDKDPREVGREGESVQAKKQPGRKAATVAPRAPAVARGTRSIAAGAGKTSITASLTRVEQSGGDGVIPLGKGKTLDVTNLDKIYFPAEKITKGDVMRYYTAIAKYILPVTKDRPLVLRRFPSGITGHAFYQHKAEDAPSAVRTEPVDADHDGTSVPFLVGGDLATILYSVQLGSISVDPWHGRVPALDTADYSIIDLDPGPRAKFDRVIAVARETKRQLDALGLSGGLKTSGSTGIHIYLPLAPGTSAETALLVAQLVAQRVTDAQPKIATVERKVAARAQNAVYVDALQNIPGKTVAASYALRAKAGATVSTPLEWSELTDDLDPAAFTIDTVPKRLAMVGDIWREAMRRKNTTRAIMGLAAR